MNVQWTQPSCARSAQHLWDRSSAGLRTNGIVPIDPNWSALLSPKGPNLICVFSNTHSKLNESWTSWLSPPNLICQSSCLRQVFSQLDPLLQLLSPTGGSGARLPLPRPRNWPNYDPALPTVKSFSWLLRPRGASAGSPLGSSQSIMQSRCILSVNRASPPPKRRSGHCQSVPCFGGGVTSLLTWGLGIILFLNWKVMTIFRLRSSTA